MITRALHPTPRTGGSCAPTRRIVRAAGKNVVRRHAPRAALSPAYPARCADGTGVTHRARLTGHLAPNTIRISRGPRRAVTRDGLVQPGSRCALRRSRTLRVRRHLPNMP